MHTLWRILIKQLLIVAVIGLPMAIIIAAAFHQEFGITLLYTVCITVCCSAIIQLLMEAAIRLRGRKERWPGWPATIGILLVGVVAGNPVGTMIGNGLSGVPNVHLLTGYTLANFLFILLVSILPAVAISYFFHSRGRLAEARTLAAEQQLRLLAAQLEPHMLFNTLANLRVLIAADPARAQSMLDHLIAFLRTTLQASRSDKHTLGNEFAHLADYLALMQVRMGERLRPVFELPAELSGVEVPPLLLQPLVENAVKHGLEPAVDGGELRISARRDDAGLLIEVRDTGVGLSTAAPGGTHFGLEQVRERLAARFGPAARLNLISPPEGGTLVQIRLP